MGKMNNWPPHPAWKSKTNPNKLVHEAQLLEHKLMRAGLYVTGRKMNEVVRSIGWELTGDIARADKPDPSGPRKERKTRGRQTVHRH